MHSTAAQHGLLLDRPGRRILRGLRRAAVFASGLTVLAGCENGALGPDPELELSVRLHVLDDRQASGLRCLIGVEASVRGDAGARARWGEAVVEVISPVVADSVIERGVVPAVEIGDLVGTESLEPGDEFFYTLVATRQLPFSGMLRQKYLPAWTAQPKEATQPFTCGPQPTPGPAPAVESLEVVGPMEPGGTGTVRYHATSPVGLWRLDLEIAGAFERSIAVELGGQVDLEDDLAFHLSYDEQVGDVIDLTLRATDLLGQISERTLVDVPLVDVSPPSIQLLARCGSECLTPVGREIHMEVTTSDASPHTVFYTVGDPPLLYDSVPRPAGYTNDIVIIPVTEELVGQHTFRTWARDDTGLEGGDTLTNRVFVYPTATTSKIRTEVQGTLTDVRIDRPRGLVYLGRADADHVLALSVTDLTPTATFPVGGGARSMDLTVSGDSLVIVVEDSTALAVVDPDGAWGPELVPLTGLDAGYRPKYVRVAADGRWLVHADYKDPGSTLLDGELLVVDPADGSQTVREQARGLHPWSRLVSSDDRSRIVVGVECTRIYEADTQTLGPCTTESTEEMATDGNGDVFADTWSTLGASWDLLHSGHPIGDRVEAVDFTPDGSRLLAVALEGMHVIDVQSWQPVVFVDGTYPTGRFDVSDDGTFGIVWGRYAIGPTVDSSTVLKIDLGPVWESAAPVGR